jgi:citrate synthase
MSRWETSIAEVLSDGDREEIIVRGHQLDDLIGKLSFAEMMFLMLQSRLPTAASAPAFLPSAIKWAVLASKWVV